MAARRRDGHDTPPSQRERHDEARLRGAAAQHDGLVPVAFVGTSWHDRTGRYWRRRIGGTLVLLLAVAAAGGIAAGITFGILGGTHPNLIRAIIGAVYVATLIPGLGYGARLVRRMPLARGSSPRSPFAGCFGLLIAPFTTGLCVMILSAALRPQFLGETRARELSRSN